MRVVFVINGLGTGGAERSLQEMLPHLADRGVECTVVCLLKRMQGVEQATRDAGTPVHVLRGGNWLTRLLELRRVLRSLQPDIVHTTIFEADILGRLSAVGTGYRVVTSLVNTSYGPERLADPRISSWKLRAGQLLDGFSARLWVDRFHAITEAVADSAVRDLRIPRQRIEVIPRGRDEERLGRPGRERRVASRSALRVPNEAEVLVNVGRQEFQKGQADLLRAVSVLREGRPRILLLVAGRLGSESPRLDELMEQEGLSGHVRLLGHREDVPEILAAADIFVFPSHFEGLGGALIEAMALGLPIVASRAPAIAESVESGGNAELVSAGDVPGLVHAIDELLDDDAMRRAWGERSRQLFEERYELDVITGRMVEFYRGVLDANA